MLSFSKPLILSLLFLGLCHCGFSNLAANSETYTSKTSQSPVYTDDEIIELYHEGVAAGATHMLIVWDLWDFEDSYTFPHYCYADQDVNDLIKYYDAPGFYKVAAVFSMDLDIHEQLDRIRTGK